MFKRVHFLKMCGFKKNLLKLNIYVFSSMFKKFKNSEKDTFSFALNLSKIKISYLFVYFGIVLKQINAINF